MAVSAKIKNLAPGAYFNAGPVEVVVLEHFTDGRTLLAAKEPIGNRPFTVRPFTYNRMEPEPAANNFAFSTLRFDLNEDFLSALDDGPWVPSRDYDLEVRLPELTLPFLDSLSCLEPLGQGNSIPVFLLRGVRVVSARTMGANDAHLRLRLLELREFLGRQVVGRKVDRRGFGARLGHLVQGLGFVGRIALHRVDQIGNQVGTALVLRLDIGPSALEPLLLVHETVVRRIKEDHHHGDYADPNPFFHTYLFLIVTIWNRPRRRRRNRPRNRRRSRRPNCGRNRPR